MLNDLKLTNWWPRFLDRHNTAGHLQEVTDSDFVELLDRYADVVRHPALHLWLFVEDDVHDYRVDDDGEVPEDQVEGAGRRRGALLVAGNMIFDRVLDDIKAMSGVPVEFGDEDLFVDEFFPARYRGLYDEAFHRKLLATVAKVCADLASPNAGAPACTAEELVLWSIVREWRSLLELSSLGLSWTDLADVLFEDMDFEALYAADLDGIENDLLAHKATGLVVNAIADWFVPFSADSLVHPYAVDLDRSTPQVYDLTADDGVGEVELADPSAPVTAKPVEGLEPVSALVVAARAAARARSDAGPVWVPNEHDPDRSLAEIEARAGSSGLLTLQPGPDAEISEVPVLQFRPHASHPTTGQAWAEVFFMSGRSEVPLNAVVSFEPDPGIQERWEAVFRPPH